MSLGACEMCYRQPPDFQLPVCFATSPGDRCSPKKAATCFPACSSSTTSAASGIDSIPDSFSSIAIRKKPSSPQSGPQLFWILQYFWPFSSPQPTSNTAWSTFSHSGAGPEGPRTGEVPVDDL